MRTDGVGCCHAAASCVLEPQLELMRVRLCFVQLRTVVGGLLISEAQDLLKRCRELRFLSGKALEQVGQLEAQKHHTA